MSTHWIALCSNGAVSLGAYEAGALAQLYADVLEVNRARPESVGIDVIAGASAGAVGGLVLAQSIAGNEPATEVTKRLRQIWIEGLDIVDLLGDVENPAKSVFDPQAFTRLAPKVVRGDAEMRASCRSDSPPVAFWIALTNVDGIPYKIELGNAPVIAGLYADYEPILVRGGLPYIAPPIEKLKAKEELELGEPRSWDHVRELAITSAAFPVAFKTQIVARAMSSYSGAQEVVGNIESLDFNYVDGGVMNNNPIGRAIDAAGFMQRCFGHDMDNRTFLILDPDPSKAEDAVRALRAPDRLPPRDQGLPPAKLASKLVGAYFNDALYRDLATAVKVNKEITELNIALEKLNLAPEQEAEIRSAVGHDYKRRIRIERIPFQARVSPLAGAFQGHFGGFLLQRYREHDFAVGAYEARLWMRTFTQGSGLETALPSDLQSGFGETLAPVLDEPSKFDGVAADRRLMVRRSLGDRICALAFDAKPGLFGKLGRGLLRLYLRFHTLGGI